MSVDGGYCSMCEKHYSDMNSGDVCPDCWSEKLMSRRSFCLWCQQIFENDTDAIAKHLYQLVVTGPADGAAWDFLIATGDKPFSKETFLKAAELVKQAV
jgi:hypothetical protein